MTQNLKTDKILQQANHYREEYLKRATSSEGKSRIEEIEFCTAGYAENGYSEPDSGVIAFGNWNTITKYTDEKFIPIDSAPSDLAKALENIDVSLEWSDEWTTCHDCGKAVRTQADSYGWKAGYAEIQGDIVCHECIASSPEEYLETLEGDYHKAVTFDEIDLEEHGYKLVASDLQNGWYGGQKASPKAIREVLVKKGVNRFIFKIDDVGQFDLTFSVYIHEDEYSLIEESEIQRASNSEIDPADQLKHDLKNLTPRVITPEEFVKGIKPQRGE